MTAPAVSAASRPDTARRAAIAGIGQTDYRRWGGHADRDEFQLGAQAIMAAAADAGLDHREIDGLVTYADTDIDASLLALGLGIDDLRLCSSTWTGRGGGSCGAIALARAAVESGQARHVAVFRSLCQGRSRRYGKFYAKRMHADMVAPYGLFSAGQGLALLVQRYRHEVGFSDEDMAAFALSFRANAQRNPRAVMHGKPLDLPAYLNARRIADPFRLFDCCLESDGACAVIVTTGERARDLPQPPVSILSAVQGSDTGWSTGGMGSHNQPRASYASSGQRQLAARLYAEAGLGPGDIDVAQLYDHFSGMLFMVLEDFGFCARGEAPAFVAAGHIAWPHGSLPLNTAGGSLSEAYVHGMNHVIEGVRQLRGSSTSQVEGARTCLVTGAAAISPSSALILGR